MSNIFLSYAHADAPRIESLKNELRRRGIIHDEDQIVDPAGLEPGESFRDTLRKEIKAASLVVVFWGQEASASANVNYEAGMADALDKQIVLVVPQGEASRPRIDAAHIRVIEMSDRAA